MTMRCSRFRSRGKTLSTEDKDTETTLLLEDGREIRVDRDPDVHWPVLARLPLARADLRQGDYGGSLLAGLVLAGANLKGCRFTDCDLSGADLSDVLAEGANFQEATFRRTVLDRIVLVEADLSDAKLSDIRAKSMMATAASFNRVTISNVYLDLSNLVDTTFVESVLDGFLVVGNGNLSGAVFNKASLKSCCFVGTLLVGASFVGASLLKTRFEACDLSGVSFRDTDLAGSSFTGCTLTGLDLSGVKNPPDLTKGGNTVKEIDVMIRRVRALAKFSGLEDQYLKNALVKLWFDHTASGGDIMTEPFEKVIDAALALAEAISADHGSR